MIKTLTYKNFLRPRIFQPNMSLLNRVLGVLVCLRAHVLGVLAYMLECSHARVLGMPTCLACLRALVFGMFTWLRVHVFSMLACFVSLCAHMFYMLAVLKYLTCLRACVPPWHSLPYFLCIWKVNFQKSLYRKIKKNFYSKKYLEPIWESMKEFFFEKELKAKSLSLFSQKG